MKRIFAVILIIISIPFTVYAGQGCCSWHGGQDYCDTETGRWVCNDGTYSPTCTCEKLQYETIQENDNIAKEKNNPILETIVAIIFFTPIIFSALLVFLTFIIAILPQKWADKILKILKINS